MGSGFLIKGFDSIPYLLGSHTPNYYNDFVKEFGMKKSRDLVSYHIDLTQPIPSSTKNAEPTGDFGDSFRWLYSRDLHSSANEAGPLGKNILA